MNDYFGGNKIKRYLLYQFYIKDEKKLKDLGIDADFKFYLSFYNIKNLEYKNIVDFGIDPASPVYFIKNKPKNLFIFRDNETKDKMKEFIDQDIMSFYDIRKTYGDDVLKFDYYPETKKFFDNLDLSKYNEWIIVFNKKMIDAYEYDVKTRILKNLGGKIIGNKNENIVVWANLKS